MFKMKNIINFRISILILLISDQKNKSKRVNLKFFETIFLCFIL